MFVTKYLFSQSLMTVGWNYMYSINNLHLNIDMPVKHLNAIHYPFQIQTANTSNTEGNDYFLYFDFCCNSFDKQEQYRDLFPEVSWCWRQCQRCQICVFTNM